MRMLIDVKRVVGLTCFLLGGMLCPAQTLYNDSFNTSVNYLTNGLAGTIWDGVYFGAGEFNNTGVLGPGATIQCDADITAPATLTLQTTGTAWENLDDDGFFLFKVVAGDFSAVVHVVSPYNNAGYNTAGLQARAFLPDGDPLNAAENFISWARFDEYGFANYLRSEVNGGVAQINPGDFPNTNYWLRMDRVGGTNFLFYEKATKAAGWQAISFPAPANGTRLARADLAGKSLQVGIMHATFSGLLGVQFTDFSLSVSNLSLAAAPLPPSQLTIVTNGGGALDISWVPGVGSAGSVVVVWPATNSVDQEIPSDGFTYSGNASYGMGSSLPAAGYFVVYAGAGTNVTVDNLAINTAYNAAVFSYAGSGSSTTYNHWPVVGNVTLPPNQIWAQVGVASAGATITFSANPGKWYWLQYSDSLSPANWQNVVPGPQLAAGSVMSIEDPNAGLTPERFYRLQEVDAAYATKVNSGKIGSLQFKNDAFPTEYINGGLLGNALIKYQAFGKTTWNPVQTSTLSGIASVSYSVRTNEDGAQYTAHYLITNGLSGAFVFESQFTLHQSNVIWTLNLTNTAAQPLTVGDLALPLPMNTVYSSVTASTMKHSFISGSDSFVFWMRPDSVGPYLLMTPDAQTGLEYWDDPTPPAGYEVYIHSFVAATNAAAEYPFVTTQGSRWRQPNTKLILPAKGSQTYSLKFQWVDNYDAIRQALVNEGKVDVHVVPGMTVPTNFLAEFALNTTQTIMSVTSEFPAQTSLQYLGATNVSVNTYQVYQVQFSKLGENELTVKYGNNQTMYLEFFVTEPLETLIKKRAAYLVSHQIITNLWYSGLFCDENMNDGQLITPDNHDTLGTSFQVYEIASDDAGESRPAYLATKEALYPVQSEVSALDYYVTNFVWGGLQCTTSESTPYGVYGVPDWHALRTNNDLSIGRGYDYPHIIAMYYGLYQVAKNHPEITTALTAVQYLTRAWGTAMAMWSYGGGQATQVGLMNEVVIPDVINALRAGGLSIQASSLQAKWETKVNYYVGGHADLFASEYAFDATGFESQEAYAKYAMLHAGSDPAMGSGNLTAFLAQLQQFEVNQITANVFDRGWLETAYYYYGSDYRGDMGDDFVVTYMAQMGGWGLLDYALNYSTNATDYLRLGYASYLCGWSTMNTGTAASNYGFWYPGATYDGGCGGGYEPSPANVTWLGGQPMHRGPWYYSAEENLGFCGAIRSGATILADDPIFGRFCYGGSWTNASDGLEVVPLDGVRQRFHAMLSGGKMHLVLNNDRFASGQVIAVQPDLSGVNFNVESDNPAAHFVSVQVGVPFTGPYNVSNVHGITATTNLTAGQLTTIMLSMDAGTSPQSFALTLAK